MLKEEELRTAPCAERPANVNVRMENVFYSQCLKELGLLSLKVKVEGNSVAFLNVSEQRKSF